MGDSCDTSSSKAKLLRDFEYDDNLSYDDNLANYRSLLNSYEQKKFDVDRQYNYWLTFTICVIYGSIAVIILLASYFSQFANQLFFDTLYYFTITFIIGTIFVIILLTYQVYNYDFPKIEKISGYEINYCPDYWNYKYYNNFNHNTRLYGSDGSASYSSDEKDHLKIQCSFKNNPNDVLQTDNLYSTTFDDDGNNYYMSNNDSIAVNLPVNKNNTKLQNYLSDDEYKKFREYASKMNGLNYNKVNDTITVTDLKKNVQPHYTTAVTDVSDIKMECSNVYPRYLAEKDLKYAEENNSLVDNKFRCAYSKICKVPWTEAGCYVNK